MLTIKDLFKLRRELKWKKNKIRQRNRKKYKNNIFEFIFNHYSDPIFVLNKASEIVSYNKAAITYFGYNSKNVHDFLMNFKPEKYIKDSLQHIQTALEGTPQFFNTIHFHKDGQQMKTHVHLIPVRSENEVEGLIGIVKDLTKFKNQDDLFSMEISVNIAQEMGNFGIWEYDIIKDEGFWSDKMYTIFGLDPSKIPTITEVRKLIHPDDHEKFIEEFNSSIKEKRSFNLEFRVMHEKENERTITGYGDIILDEKENPIKIVGTTYDVTEQKNIKAQLKQREEQLLKISENLDAGIWSKDIKTNTVVYASKGTEKITGYSQGEFEENSIAWEDLVFEEDVPFYTKRQIKLLLGKIQKDIYRIQHKNGNIRWIQDASIPIFDEKGNIVRLDGIITDMTEQKLTEERMAHIAYHDHLTGLANRRNFERKLRELVKTSNITQTKFALLFLNLDEFKRLNDTLGHLIGDKLLQETSNRLRNTTSSNGFISRMGGDEFTILFSEISDIEQLLNEAKNIAKALEQPFIIDDYDLFITGSIGIATFPEDGTDEDTLLRNADTALHRAKEMGKNNYQIYNSSMNIASFKLYNLEKDLRKAIKNEELLLHYQPKVDAKTGKMIGAEALIRWNHPEWGMVSPGEFIPLAEENDLIFTITDWTFLTVCQQIKQWEKENLDLIPISINISPKRFLKIDWFDKIISMMEETKVNPKLLELEIIETSLIQNEDSLLSSLKKLKEIGMKISLDDFGTGFSSLLQLKKLNVNTVKIDRNFIKDISKEKNAIITKSIIYLAHGLNMTVVAEGVETENQLDFLRQHGCDQIQGYYFSRPLPVQEITPLLSNPILKRTEEIRTETFMERRRGIRIDLPFPLKADMTISQVNEQKVELGKTEILIENMGQSGLRILTQVKLPINPRILYQLQTMLLGRRLLLYGRVMWKQEVEQDYYQYGIKLVLNQTEEKQLSEAIKQLGLEFHSNLTPGESEFVTENRFSFLQQSLKKRRE